MGRRWADMTNTEIDFGVQHISCHGELIPIRRSNFYMSLLVNEKENFTKRLRFSRDKEPLCFTKLTVFTQVFKFMESSDTMSNTRGVTTHSSFCNEFHRC